jgi:hypothetical protein
MKEYKMCWSHNKHGQYEPIGPIKAENPSVAKQLSVLQKNLVEFYFVVIKLVNVRDFDVMENFNVVKMMYIYVIYICLKSLA